MKNALFYHAKLGQEALCKTLLADQRLKVDFRTTTNGRVGGLLARTGSLSGHPSKQQPRSTLLDLFTNNALTDISSHQPVSPRLEAKASEYCSQDRELVFDTGSEVMWTSTPKRCHNAKVAVAASHERGESDWEDRRSLSVKIPAQYGGLNTGKTAQSQYFYPRHFK
ncbi:hypothetical protein J6590_073126 [Homalodisca vitripennis]|nr:hypothetical protein J6590_073126 [Homalodisca vitripennis]